MEEQSRSLAAFRQRFVDGVLLLQATGDDPELTRMVETKRPVVFVGRLPKNVEADVVANKIYAGTKAGVEYLIRKGHKHIGLLTVEKSLTDPPSALTAGSAR